MLLLADEEREDRERRRIHLCVVPKDNVYGIWTGGIHAHAKLLSLAGTVDGWRECHIIALAPTC